MANTYPTNQTEGPAGTQTGKVLQKASVLRRARSAQRASVTRRWVIYDFDADTLITTQVFQTYAEAVDAASQLHDVLVLPLIFENVCV